MQTNAKRGVRKLVEGVYEWFKIVNVVLSIDNNYFNITKLLET